MSKPPDVVYKLSETLTLCEYQSPKNGNFGFWLYDKTQSMNLSMKAKTAEAAFVEALTYYQKRLAAVKGGYDDLQARVDAFVSQFADTEELE